MEDIRGVGRECREGEAGNGAWALDWRLTHSKAILYITVSLIDGYFAC